MRRPLLGDPSERPLSSARLPDSRPSATKDYFAGFKNMSIERGNTSVDVHKPRKHLSNNEIFRQIINERHSISKLSQAEPFNRFSKKVVTPSLRNGIITRAFSRSKLELFTRPDPNELTLSLKTRVNSIVHNLQGPFKGFKAKPLSKHKPIMRIATEDKSYDHLENSEKKNSRTLADQSNITLSLSKKDLSIRDFPFERAGMQLHQGYEKSCKNPKKPREMRYVSLNICLKKPASSSSTDFFPQRYRLVAQKDRAVVNAFSHSYTSSERNSTTRNRASEKPRLQS
jgi:hypothetical protein